MAGTRETTRTGDPRSAATGLVTVDTATTASTASGSPAVTSPGSGGSGGVDGTARGGGGGAAPAPRAPGLRRRLGRLVPRALGAITSLPFAMLMAILVVLVWKAIPAIRYNGIGFFTHSTWNLGSLYSPVVTPAHGVAHPPGAEYGALPLIVGTVASSAIAVILAVPVAVGTALIVVEKLPPRLSSGAGFCLEVLAGVPSVVFGLWGVFTLGPFLAHDVAPIWADHMPDVPVLRFFRSPTGGGTGLFTTGVILAIMIVPIVAATTRDLLRQVPRATVEGALALGLTESEAVGAVTLPWVRSGVIGASVLGLGRALGETIAVAMVSGSITGYPHSFYSSFGTIAATILNTLESALGDASGLAVSSLAELALVLLVISLIANVGARVLVRRTSGTALPVGRGI